jgi:hypothetical protein
VLHEPDVLFEADEAVEVASGCQWVDFCLPEAVGNH